MTLCDFENGQCVRCRAPMLNQRQVCGSWSPGLGDRLAAGLAAFGITKERVNAVAQAVGVTDCGCDERQRKLNELGRKLGIGGNPQNS